MGILIIEYFFLNYLYIINMIIIEYTFIYIQDVNLSNFEQNYYFYNSF